jgi:hypothetical protein
MLYFYLPNIFQTFLEYFYQFFFSLDQSRYCLARICAVNAATAHRRNLIGKIVLLIINELCFAKQYLHGAARALFFSTKKSPVLLRGIELNLLTHLLYLFCNTSLNNFKEPFIIVVSLIASSIDLKLLCNTKALPSLEYQTSYVLLLGDKIIFVVIVIRI